ncbi:MAG: DUF6382 domain-containing protein, partial [Coriobacteriales bacterium]|nr:DUF6382 domain-containing protein [Coriobacteriales bacterium]
MKKNGEAVLKVSLGKHDAFDYATATRISRNAIGGLLEFTFSGKDERPDIYFNITNLVDLPTFLSNKLSVTQFQHLVTGILEVLESVYGASLQEKNLMLAKENVYVDEDARIYLAYLPLTGREASERAVLDLLAFISDNVSFVNQDNREYSAHLLDYLKKQTVFSLFETKAFLGIAASTSHKDSVHSEDIFTRVKPVRGRDFVAEFSGIKAREEVLASRTVAENIMSAVSDELVTGE